MQEAVDDDEGVVMAEVGDCATQGHGCSRAGLDGIWVFERGFEVRGEIEEGGGCLGWTVGCEIFKDGVTAVAESDHVSKESSGVFIVQIWGCGQFLRVVDGEGFGEGVWEGAVEVYVYDYTGAAEDYGECSEMLLVG